MRSATSWFSIMWWITPGDKRSRRFRDRVRCHGGVTAIFVWGLVKAMVRLQLDEKVQALRALTGGSKSCGWVYDEIGFLLYSLIKFYKPALVVQTGHLWGKSACIMLEALTDGFLTGTACLDPSKQSADERFSEFVAAHAPSPYDIPKVISVDPGPLDVPNPYGGIEHLKQEYPGHFEFYNLPSHEFFRVYGRSLRSQFENKRILGVVDGDHSPNGCLDDLINMRALGAGMIFVDDTRWLPYIGTLSKAFAGKYGYGFLELPHYNGVAILQRGEPARGFARVASSAWRTTGGRGLRLLCRLAGMSPPRRLKALARRAQFWSRT